MSFLAPLYLLAAAAITLPILFHLIQRRPRGEQLFSSLMFLSPSPPRMVRRSRVDQWLLLLLRALALLAIAFAFTRPFFRSSDTTATGALGRQRLILIDTSASMQRDGLWSQVQSAVESIIAESTPQDSIAIYRYDTAFQPVVSFETVNQLAPQDRSKVLRQSMTDLKPSWLATDLGRGLSIAAETLQTAVNNLSEEESLGGEIILLSDFSGSINLSQLEEYDWPKSVRVVPNFIKPREISNATLTSLSNLETGEEAESGLRLLLTNSSNSEISQFQLHFLDSKNRAIQTVSTPYQVPSGERRVIRLTEIPSEANAVELIGDKDPSDNKVYFSSPQKRPIDVWILQRSSDSDERQLGFFVERIPLNSNTLEVFFKRQTPAEILSPPDPGEVPLIIVDASIDSNSAALLRAYTEKGGKVVVALDQPIGDQNRDQIVSALQTLLADKQIQISEAKVPDYAMWSHIDFQHPLFAPFADSRFNDFTKMRTWRHRQIDLTDSHPAPLVTFDNGVAAIREFRLGSGRIWLFASGWQPAESQLALSTKFVPLMLGIFRFSATEPRWPTSLYAGQTLDANPEMACLSPAGSPIISNTNNQWELVQPGVYQFVQNGESKPVAVNVLPREFELSQMDPDRLEQLGVTTGSLPNADIVRENQRLMRNAELEKQQQVWRWGIYFAIALIVLETIWSSISSARTSPATAS